VVVLGDISRGGSGLFHPGPQRGHDIHGPPDNSHLPPTAALFAAFLGYNPMAHLLPASALQHLPAAARATVLGRESPP
jgi:hypothetical protein